MSIRSIKPASTPQGGGIELSILARQYGAEICAFDLMHLREDVFGESLKLRRRIFLAYTGDHYDAMVYAPGVGGVLGGGAGAAQGELRVFLAEDVGVWEKARTLAEFLHQKVSCRVGMPSHDGGRPSL